MRSINIKSLLQANSSLKDIALEGYLNHYGIAIRSEEIDDLDCLVKSLQAQIESIEIFDKFYVGFKIPQISKEFDLLRFGKDYVINIELKKISTEERVKKQLMRNKYYLGFLGLQVYCFSYISELNKLYLLNNDDFLEEVEIEILAQLLCKQTINNLVNIDNLFDPSIYLVSPFNSTQKFLRDEYFLTLQQNEVKAKIMQLSGVNGLARFVSLTGSAGTGKTLLTYDIAKQLLNNQGRPLIIHCGNLNDGQEELIRNGWDIIPAKIHANYDLASYDLIVVDEAQRIYLKQLEDIVERVVQARSICIFSYDKSQTLSNSEETADASKRINSIDSINTFNLSEKIRTNKEISTFIKMLLNCKRNIKISRGSNIEISYFASTKDAKNYLESLDQDGWEVLRFTPSTYNTEPHNQYSDSSNKTSHEVMGQEFDSVAVAIDKNFSYNLDGELTYKARSYYKPTKMLFQNITRARKRLKLVIIDNEEILSRCIQILK